MTSWPPWVFCLTSALRNVLSGHCLPGAKVPVRRRCPSEQGPLTLNDRVLAPTWYEYPRELVCELYTHLAPVLSLQSHLERKASLHCKSRVWLLTVEVNTVSCNMYHNVLMELNHQAELCTPHDPIGGVECKNRTAIRRDAFIADALSR